MKLKNMTWNNWKVVLNWLFTVHIYDIWLKNNQTWVEETRRFYQSLDRRCSFILLLILLNQLSNRGVNLYEKKRRKCTSLDFLFFSFSLGLCHSIWFGVLQNRNLLLFLLWAIRHNTLWHKSQIKQKLP